MKWDYVIDLLLDPILFIGHTDTNINKSLVA